MEHINISWCEQVSVKGVEALARGCMKLKAFICKGCSLVCMSSFQDHLIIMLFVLYFFINIQGCWT